MHIFRNLDIFHNNVPLTLTSEARVLIQNHAGSRGAAPLGDVAFLQKFFFFSISVSFLMYYKGIKYEIDHNSKTKNPKKKMCP